ncbi:hypothetical protein QQ045_027776 [Rhodiola kirilowii]
MITKGARLSICLKYYASAENKEAVTEGLGPEYQPEVNKSVPNETEDAELFAPSANEREKNQPKGEESVEEKLTADDDENVMENEISKEANVQQDKQAHVRQISDGTGNLERSVSYSSDEKQASLKSDSEPDPDDTDILEKFSDPDPDDSKNLKNVSETGPNDSGNKEKVDKTEIPDECDEVTQRNSNRKKCGRFGEDWYPFTFVLINFLTRFSPKRKMQYMKLEFNACLPALKTDEQHTETIVPDEVSTVSCNIVVKPATYKAPELSVEDSVLEEDSIIQIPEIKTEETQESEPTEKVHSQKTQEPESDAEQVEEPGNYETTESDVEHVEEPGNYETVSIVQEDDANIEIKISKASDKVITRVIEGAEGLSLSIDASVEASKPEEAGKDSISKEEEIKNVSQVLVQPDDSQGEEIDHLPSNIEVTELATSSMMKQRHKIEREQNIGDEVGWSKNREVAKKNPKLAAMNKKFGMIHGLSSLANIMAFGSLAMHSWYFAGKINFSGGIGSSSGTYNTNPTVEILRDAFPFRYLYEMSVQGMDEDVAMHVDDGESYAYGDGDDDGIGLGSEEEEDEDEDYWHCKDEVDDHVHLRCEEV